MSTHELLHAVEWCYSQAEKTKDFEFPSPKNEKEFLTLPHEIRAYTLNTAQFLKNKKVTTWEEMEKNLKKDFRSKRQLEALSPKDKKTFLKLVWLKLIEE